MVSVRNVDDKLKRIGHSLSAFRVDGFQGMVSVRNVDDKLKRIGHSLSAFRVDGFQGW